MGSWGILELMRVKHSGACRIGGLRGCVLGAQCGKRNREGEGGQENRVRLLCACVCRAHTKMGAVQEGLHAEGAALGPTSSRTLCEQSMEPVF